MKTTLGGDRLGSGNKQAIDLKTYNRSTHDLGYIWRSTMASGTLVPFMTELGLPGDTFEIDLDIDVKTHPTIGPLFGSYKIQMDVFQVPIRLYHGKLHMNQLGIGLDMAKIKLPQLQIEAISHAPTDTESLLDDNEQINPSCLLSYLNIRGVGRVHGVATTHAVKREFNAIPYLAYWDIYKNYYANKQEEIGMVIHNPMTNQLTDVRTNAKFLQNGGSTPIAVMTPTSVVIEAGSLLQTWWTPCPLEIAPDPHQIKVRVQTTTYNATDVFKQWEWYAPTGLWVFSQPYSDFYGTKTLSVLVTAVPKMNVLQNSPKLQSFPLKNIDTMRENILKWVDTPTPLKIDGTTIEPYGLTLFKSAVDNGYSKLSTQEGLAIKTYQSDLFNNWISTEWIDGDNGVNAITAVDTTSGEFTIDALNLANKVYNLLNRIAVSGGSYDDWLDAVYAHERTRSTESPVYMGGLIKELAFQEVISTAEATSAEVTQPLGTLAGRGVMTGKHKGGKINVKISEPSYIIGIVSLTPRIDYSQGNKWDTNLKTMDDLHKPALDEIGYQDLITDQMAWFDTNYHPDFLDTPIFSSAGKQPAWINYMTNVNQVRGNFAESKEQMFMTLNRRYEFKQTGIQDLTTYVDPVKFNHIFADTRLDAQNFWVQIGIDNIARRKISAKVIPNL